MTRDVLLYEIKQLLERKTIQDLYRLTRALSIYHRANERKDETMELILRFARAELDPTPRNGRGAPVKSNEYDKELAAAVLKCRDMYLADLRGEEYVDKDAISDAEYERGWDFKGLLERGSKYFFVKNLLENTDKDIFIGTNFVEKYNLKIGDLITGHAVDSDRSGLRVADRFATVNGYFPDMVTDRKDFNKFKAIYPDKQLRLSVESGDIALRQIELFAPLGAGQRSLIIAPPKSGKTSLIREIAMGFKTNQPENSRVIILVTGAFPEEVTEYNKLESQAELFFTLNTDGAAVHAHFANMAGEHAARIAESGEDVLLLIDNMDALISACRTAEKSPDAPVEVCPYEVRRLLSLARNMENSGTITVVGAVNTLPHGNDFGRGETFLYLLEAANSHIALCNRRSYNSTFPLLDVKRCFSDKRDLFSTAEEIAAAEKLCEMVEEGKSAEDIADIFKDTESNAELVEKYR